MKKILVLIILGLLAFPQLAQAQSQRNPCIYLTTSNNNCQPVGSSTNGVGNSPMPVGGLATAVAPTYVEGKPGSLSFDLAGNLRVNSGGGGGAVTQGTIPWVVSGQGAAGTAATGVVTVQGIASMTPVIVNQGTSPWVTSSSPATTGGLSTFFVQPAASDNHTNIKNGAGQVYYAMVFNNSATVNYLRFYDAGTGFNGCNSATNHLFQIQIPASTSVGGAMIPIGNGITFATGISICVTSGYALTDTTNATATAMSITVGYK